MKSAVLAVALLSAVSLMCSTTMMNVVFFPLLPLQLKSSALSNGLHRPYTVFGVFFFFSLKLLKKMGLLGHLLQGTPFTSVLNAVRAILWAGSDFVHQTDLQNIFHTSITMQVYYSTILYASIEVLFILCHH